jgi:peptidoglycan hydrolase-like protein with peptidoglycan-binding domain
MYLKPNYALGGPNSCQCLSGIKHISGYAQASYNRKSSLNPYPYRSLQPQVTLRHVIICASTNDSSSSRPQRRKSNSASTDPLSLPFSYTQDLLAREAELWKRQSQLLDELKEQYANEIQRWVEERAIWQAQEQSLKREISDLRAQLLYALSSGLVPSIDNRNSNSNSNKTLQMDDVVQPRQLGETMGQPSYQSATTNNSSNSNIVPKTPAEEVQAVLNASRQADSTTTTTTTKQASTSFSSELPSFASEFMQAMHAPDDTDVLDSALDFSGWQQRKSMKREERRSLKQDDDNEEEEEGVVKRKEKETSPSSPSSPSSSSKGSTGSTSIQPAPLEAELFYETPPPPLAFGDDDLFWVNQLHTGLVAKGYYPGDDDIEDFMFTDGTQRAVMTMQACEGLVESGVVDEATWKVLLGPELRPLPPNRKLTPYDEASDTEEHTTGAAAAAICGNDNVAALPASSSRNSDKGKPFIELFSATMTDTFTTNEGEDGKITTRSHKIDINTEDKLINQTTGKVEEQEEVDITLEKWPVLMEGDGGREVHALHVVLTREGYYPGEDDIRWWTYGDTTVTAVKTFQACQGMPESGVVDMKMWGVLMGGDAVPSDIYKVKSGESDDDDLAQNWDGDRVWLMGEQRWETINKKKSELE